MARMQRLSTITPQDRARQRLRKLAWHARYHARTPSEAQQVRALVEAVHQGHVAPADAHQTLAALRADQQTTAALHAA